MLTIATSALVGARVGELHRANNQLLTLGIGRVTTISWQNTVYFTPQHLWCRPAAENTLQAHLRPQQEYSILLRTPQLHWSLIRWTHFNC
jgi:hypothetical protein